MRVLAVGNILALLVCTVALAAKPASVSKLRSAGEVAFSKGELDQAKQLFAQVIRLEPKEPRNYYKRFRVALKQRKYEDAIADLSTAVDVDPKYKQGWVQRAKLLKMIGDCKGALSDYQHILTFDPANKDAAKDIQSVTTCAHAITTAEQAFQRNDFGAALAHYSAAIETSTTSITLLVKRAHVNFKMGNFFEVVADTGKSLKIEKTHMESLELRGRAYYQMADHDMAMRHWREGLRFDPDHKECKTHYRRLKKLLKFNKNAEEAALEGKHEESAAIYKELSEIDPGHGVFNLDALQKGAQMLLDAKKYTEAQAAAQAVLQRFGEGQAKALKILGNALVGLEEWQEAVNALKKAHQHDQQDAEIRADLQKAEAALKQSKTKDYYKILAVPRDADKRAIKKAYKVLALQWHPDKHTESDEANKAAVKKFQEIAEAQEVLTDPELRAKYDRGEEVFENQGGGGPPGGGRHFHHGGQQFQFHFG